MQKNIPNSVSSFTSALSWEAQPDGQAGQHTALFGQTVHSQKAHIFWKFGKYVEFYSSGKINKSLLLKSYLPDKYFAPLPFFQTNFMIPYSQIYIEQSHHHAIHNFQTMSLYMAAIL